MTTRNCRHDGRGAILGTTAKQAANGIGGLAIGPCLTVIHLVSIPVPNTSVNPARSTGSTLFDQAQTGQNCSAVQKRHLKFTDELVELWRGLK